MRVTIVLILAIATLASCGGKQASWPTTTPTTALVDRDTFAFLQNYHIAHYLESAADFQKMESDKRTAKLQDLAKDPQRASEIFPLCRMLFEAKPGGDFRGPGLGVPGFVGGSVYDWPLEPIALVDNAPILIVRGYSLAGVPEPPEWYLDYCLKECRWRNAKYAVASPAELKEIVEKFITANPNLTEGEEWLRRQAD